MILTSSDAASRSFFLFFSCFAFGIECCSYDNLQEKMAFLETEGARNVIEACGRAAYARRCIFTSSLLASIWTDNNLDRVIDEKSWSNEEFCIENKVHS